MNQNYFQHQLQEHEQLCFIHVPKTAGTTFTSIIDAKFDDQKICPARVWGELTELATQEDLGKYRLLRGHFYYYVYKFLPTKPIYITMLRDPIERVISGYEFMKRFRPSRPEGLPAHEKAIALSLKEYVCDPTVPGIINAQTRHFTQNLYKEVPDFCDRRWLEDAKEHIQEFIFIGITERFQDSMRLLSYTFGWNPLVQYQNLMVAPKRLRQEDLDQDVIDAIAERNQLDIELYQYAKQIFEHRYAQMLQELFAQYPEIQPAAIDSKTLHGMLEKHYEQRYLEVNSRLLESLSFRFDQAMSGSGWHLLEGNSEDNTIFRWTGPGTESILDFPIAIDRGLMIEFRIINVVAPDILESLTLEINDHPVELKSFYCDQKTVIFQGVIPKVASEHNKPFSRLIFRVNRTVSPQSIDPTNPDDRPVGLAFNFLQVFPAASVSEMSAASYVFACQAWQSTVDYVQEQLQTGEKLLAPTVFSLKFSDQMQAKDVLFAGRTSNYKSSFTKKNDFQWIIIHKGMKDEIGLMLTKLIFWGFKPVFANEVFVIFSSNPRSTPLSYTDPHVRSLYGGYLKFYVNQKKKSLLMPLRAFKLRVVQKSGFFYDGKIKPLYVKHLRKNFAPDDSSLSSM